MQKKSLLAIHEAIEAGKKAGKSMPLSGAITVCSLENVMSGGGILSSQQEVGTITLGSPYSTVRVSEDGEDKIERCVMEKVHFAYNALKLDEISGNEVMSAFKSSWRTRSSSWSNFYLPPLFVEQTRANDPLMDNLSPANQSTPHASPADSPPVIRDTATQRDLLSLLRAHRLVSVSFADSPFTDTTVPPVDVEPMFTISTSPFASFFTFALPSLSCSFTPSRRFSR